VNLPTTGLDLLPFADHILGEVTAFFTANNVALPERQYIAPGLPSLDSWDCEQCMVGVVGIQNSGSRAGDPGRAPKGGTPASVYTMRAVSYAIQIVRCVPVLDTRGNPPPPEDIDLAGRQQIVDMGLLSQCVVNIAAAPPAWILPGAGIQAGAVAPLGPNGGLAAIESMVTLTGAPLMPEVP
jgi:hypothetical protein